MASQPRYDIKAARSRMAEDPKKIQKATPVRTAKQRKSEDTNLERARTREELALLREQRQALKDSPSRRISWKTPYEYTGGSKRLTKPPHPPVWQITTLMLLSFLMVQIDKGNLSKDFSVPQEEGTLGFLGQYVAWAFLYIVLIAGADFEPTRDLALAFALLIFISVLFVAPSSRDEKKPIGAVVLQGIADWVGFKETSTPAASGTSQLVKL
jgi:hypothetical protein